MRFVALLVSLASCSFPEVTYDASTDGPMDSASPSEAGLDSAGSDGGDSGRKCTTDFECDIHCAGTLPSCSCVAFFAGQQPPTCDTTCMTACGVKKAGCDAGTCVAQ